MNIWIDAQLSPSLTHWITENFEVTASAVRDLGLRDSKDFEIFESARKANAVILTKDADFPHLLSQHGPPPQVIWLTCGNTSNKFLQRILKKTFILAINQIKAGEPIVEITGISERSQIGIGKPPHK